MNKNLCRVISFCLLLLLLVCSCSMFVFADDSVGETLPPEELPFDGKMMQGFLSFYSILRDKIAVPLLIISYATCGFKILSAGFSSQGGSRMIDSAKKQFLYSTLALFVLCLLPSLINSTITTLKSSGWKPT